MISGPMFSKKSRRLIEMLREEVKSRSVMAAQPTTNSRDDVIRSRDGMWFPAAKLRSTDLHTLERYSCAGYAVGIDEAQFFEPWAMLDLAGHFTDEESLLIVAGLDYDSERREWGPIIQLAGLANEVIQCRADCNGCGKLEAAPFTFYEAHKTESLKVGDDGYQARCLACWDQGQAAKGVAK